MANSVQMLSINTALQLISVMLQGESKRTGFGFEIQSANEIQVQLGTDTVVIPIEGFPNIYESIMWEFLKKIPNARQCQDKIFIKNYYVATRNKSGVVANKELLDKVPDLLAVSFSSTTRKRVLTENLTAKNLKSLLSWTQYVHNYQIKNIERERVQYPTPGRKYIGVEDGELLGVVDFDAKSEVLRIYKEGVVTTKVLHSKLFLYELEAGAQSISLRTLSFKMKGY